MDMIYSAKLGLKLIHVSKRGIMGLFGREDNDCIMR